MNVLVKTIGGGVFSKFITAIDSIMEEIPVIDDIHNIYIEIDTNRVDRSRQIISDVNPFDYVLEQDKTLNFTKTINAKHRRNYHNIISNTKIENLRKICDKIKIKGNILSNISDDITENTLGVHVRLTDMNSVHGSQYGKKTTQNYISKIREFKTDNIFVSSDNLESLDILSSNFNIIFNEVNNRCEDVLGSGYNKYLREMSNEEVLWKDSFIEMLSLSRCGELIYNTSNLNNISILYSKTIKKTHKI